MERLLRAALGLGLVLVVTCVGIARGDDSVPTRQAEAINGEFLANLPAPASDAKAVCIVDTGVDVTPDLEDAVVYRDALDGGSVADLSSDHHGTKVAQVLAGKAANGWGSTGIWPGVKVISVRASSEGDPDTYGWQEYIDGIERCFDRASELELSLGVVNLSLGDLSASDDELDAVEEIVRRTRELRDLSVVAAAGNSNGDVSYPARFESALAVGAIASVDAGFCSFSNRGTGLDISAVGCELDLANELGDLVSEQGTSFSAPEASAVIAAMRSYAPELNVDDAEQLLIDSAKTTSAGKVLDADAAFRAAGLGSIVDQYQPAAEAATDSGSVSIGPFETSSASGSSEQSIGTQSTTVLTVASEDSLTAPKITSALLTGKHLTLKIGSWHSGALLIIKIGKRKYVFRKKKLRINLTVPPRFTSIRLCWLKDGKRSPWRTFKKSALTRHSNSSRRQL